MPRQALEVADIFRDHGPAWRREQAGHLSLGQLKVMSAIERCRTAALGGHVAQCPDCGHRQIAYNSCRNRHCPKCQGAVAKQWLAARMADLLPVEYYHVVFTLPAPIGQIAYHNKAVIYSLLFAAAAETLLTIAADPKHLGARIGVTLVLHTWGSALTHHPHVHGIVPGGGISLDGERWVACPRGFFLPVRVLSRLFRRLFCAKLSAAQRDGQLQFFGEQAGLSAAAAFEAWLAPLRAREWVVYAKRPFAGPEAVLAYLSRYTHRVAIANSRLIACDERGVTFQFKDYRAKGRCRYKPMTLPVGEFIRRFLLHVLPPGFMQSKGLCEECRWRAAAIFVISTDCVARTVESLRIRLPSFSTPVEGEQHVDRVLQTPIHASQASLRPRRSLPGPLRLSPRRGGLQPRQGQGLSARYRAAFGLGRTN